MSLSAEKSVSYKKLFLNMSMDLVTQNLVNSFKHEQ